MFAEVRRGSTEPVRKPFQTKIPARTHTFHHFIAPLCVRLRRTFVKNVLALRHGNLKDHQVKYGQQTKDDTGNTICGKKSHIHAAEVVGLH